jgi:hypothetical protein
MPPSAAPATLATRHLREYEDTYPRVIARLDSKTRIVECRDRVQWIVQKRSGNRWRGVSFHRDRDVLIERCGPMSRGALTALRALPPHHPGQV